MSEKSVTLEPTEGGYQKDIQATLVRETDTMWVVKVPDKMADWRFSKSTGFRVGPQKHDFPRYRINMPLKAVS